MGYETLQEGKPIKGYGEDHGFYVSQRKAVVLTVVVCLILVAEGDLSYSYYLSLLLRAHKTRYIHLSIQSNLDSRP